VAENEYNNILETKNKYLYNGKEFQDELSLNCYDYGARMYDGAIGRFMVQDAYAEKYHWMSPFQYGANNPVLMIDINGDSLFVTYGSRTLKYYNGIYYEANGSIAKTNKKGKIIGEGRSFFNQTLKNIGNISSTERGLSLVGGIASNSEFNITIHQSDDQNKYDPNSEISASDGNGTGGNVYWNPNNTSEGGVDITGSTSRPAFIGLAHELAHGEDAISGNMESGSISINIDPIPNPTRGNWFPFKNADKYATHIENIIRSQYHRRSGRSIPLRAFYGIDNTSGTRRGIIPLIKNGNESIYYPNYRY